MYADALEAADRAVLFKAATKEIAGEFGIIPTFMAKISPDLPGCSGHVHQSLWDLEHKTNVFYEEGADRRMSKTFSSVPGRPNEVRPSLSAVLCPDN